MSKIPLFKRKINKHCNPIYIHKWMQQLKQPSLMISRYSKVLNSDVTHMHSWTLNLVWYHKWYENNLHYNSWWKG